MKLPEGFTAIESVEQMFNLPNEKYILRAKNGCEFAAEKRGWRGWHVNGNTDYESRDIASVFIGFRHIPDTPVGEPDGGFEKRPWAQIPGDELHKYLRKCHDYIDKQAAERLASMEQVANQCAAAFQEQLDQKDAEIHRLNAYAQSLELALSSSAKELSQLKAAREWQPVTVEALEAAPDGTYEFIYPCKAGRKLRSGLKSCGGWAFTGVSRAAMSEIYSHFRLITRAEDFTPPERLIKIEGGEYTVEQLQELISEQ